MNIGGEVNTHYNEACLNKREWTSPAPGQRKYVSVNVSRNLFPVITNKEKLDGKVLISWCERVRSTSTPVKIRKTMVSLCFNVGQLNKSKTIENCHLRMQCLEVPQMLGDL